MPAASSALDRAGLRAEGGFVNSARSDSAVGFLGDVFAVPAGMPLANVFSIGDVLLVVGLALLLWQLPRVIATSRGVYDGAILPAGLELPRLALSVPLFVSAALILLTALLDLAKMAAGMPENVTDHHPEI